MTEYDENLIAIPGTYAISTVSLGAWGKNGKPMPTATSAVCHTCGEWASQVWVTGRGTSLPTDDFHDRRVSQTITVVTYACPQHADAMADVLMDEWETGWASNVYEPDDLAEEVSATERMHRRREREHS